MQRLIDCLKESVRSFMTVRVCILEIVMNSSIYSKQKICLNEEKFDALKSNIENSVKVQAKVYDRHNAQVQSLKALAEKDRAWLEEETSKRRAASIAMRKRTEVQVTRMQRRISTGW